MLLLALLFFMVKKRIWKKINCEEKREKSGIIVTLIHYNNKMKFVNYPVG